MAIEVKPSLQRLTTSGNHLITVAPFLLILALLAGLFFWELRIEDGSRVFLAGENLWDGGQKAAALCLLNYADTHSDQKLGCFQREIDVVIGDMQARNELDSPRPSISIVTQGFLRGRNHPNDIPKAITLYRFAAFNSEMEKAIQAWRDADPYILRLVVIAGELQHNQDNKNTQQLKQEILQIDETLTLQERSFAEHLNNGMHLLAVGLGLVQAIADLLLISLAIVVSRRLNRTREASQKQAFVLAYYDPLTDLPNRSLVHDRLNSALAAARDTRKKIAVLCLDLDRFKIINDSLGHSVGDSILKEVAQRLKQYVRDEDTVARFGGDEFLIILTNLDDSSDAANTAKRILNAITADFVNCGYLFGITGTIGISMFPENGSDSETLIKNADAAMYCAKEGGRNRLRFFADEMNTAVVERLTLENNLRMALEGQEFSLVYQPQMEVASGSVTGLEALLRWKSRQLGVVPPDKFIRVAENSGLVLPIGQWVLETACRRGRRWLDDGLLHFPIAVNVSAVQFRQEGFCDLIRRVLHETGLPSRFLELELTESVLLSDADIMFQVLMDLNSMGVRLAIDDFGTGFSSLSYLSQLPVKKLKIDRSFIRFVAANSDDAAITTAVIRLARSLNLRSVAEGVESADQLNFLRNEGCDEIQGYYFSKPLSEEAVSKLLASPPIPDDACQAMICRDISPVSAQA